MQNFDDLKEAHEADQFLAEALALSDVKIVGKDEHGADVIKLTAKGAVKGAVLFLEHLIRIADAEKRDFSDSEIQEALSQVKNLAIALQEEQEEKFA